MGSGPYTLTSLDETAGTMTMTLKDNWWGDEKPAIKTINVRTITDPSTLVIALQKGEIDVSSLMGSSLRLVEGDKNLVMKQSISVVPFQLLINANTEPLNNGKLREAISYAIDYNAIRNATCSGYVSSKDSTIVFATPEMDIPAEVQQYSYDPDRARQLVAESGLSTPVDVGEIIGGTSNGSAEMVQQYLEAVGIQAKVTSYETNTMVQMLMSGQFGLGITTGAGGQSAFENLLNYYGTNQPYNFNKFSNAEVDAILEQILNLTDMEYVQCAKSYGTSSFKIILRHVLPNALGPIIIMLAGSVSGTILGAASYSFMGFGVQQPTPEWGAIISASRQFMRLSPTYAIIPGMAIVITAMSINLVGDGLRDALDPRLKD